MIDRTFIDNFLAANPSVPPVRISTPDKGSRLWEFAHARLHVGWYRVQEGITVFPDLCTKPGHGYSWPGHISDRTVQGVLAHELGHHCHHTRPDADHIRAIFPRRHKVTGYEPNADESFAESFRLFVLNPHLLRQGRPERFKFLIDLGFVPSELRPWFVVLGDAPQRILARIPDWLRRGGGSQENLPGL